MVAAPPDSSHGAHAASKPDIAVVVVNWQREEATIACCRRLLEWRRLRLRLVVVDNGSEPDSLARLRNELAEATVVAAGHNRGFGGANNLALEHLDTEFSLLLNNDAVLDESDATRLVDFLAATPQAGFAGPVIEDAAAPHAILSAGGRDILRYARTHLRAGEREAQLASGLPFEADYVPGTIVLVRTSVLRRLGGFEEAYFFSGEMADLAARATALGFGSWIVPAARGRHDMDVAGGHRASLYAYYSLRNRFLHARRHARHAWLQLGRWTLRGLASSLAALLTGHPLQARCLARGVVDGIAARFGPATRSIPR